MRPWLLPLLALAACAAEMPVEEDAPALSAPPDSCAILGMYKDGQCDTGCILPDPDCGLIVVGHRGSPFSATENTMPSYRAAMAEGATAIELDLCLTGDGQVMVVHDCDPSSPMAVIRQSGAEGFPYVPYFPPKDDPFFRPVWTMTAEELVTHWGYARRETPTVRDPAAVMPSFAEFADWARGEGRLEAVFLDIKVGPSQMDRVVALADQIADLTEGIDVAFYFMSPFPDVLEAIREEVRTHHPTHPGRFALDFQARSGFDEALALGADAMSVGANPFWSWSDYVASLRAFSAGHDFYPVVVWTIDDEAKAREVIGAGADGIMSNRPAMISALRQ